MEIEWSSKEWSRVIYLMRKGMRKKPTETDTKLLYKALIFAEQAKKDDDEMADILKD